MLVEPYIAIRGHLAGNIEYRDAALFQKKDGTWVCDGDWIPYADFEREKLRELGSVNEYIKAHEWGYSLGINLDDGVRILDSEVLIHYSHDCYEADSESSRLLNRAEFLKAVCEKEGVEWLPATGGYVAPKSLDGYRVGIDWGKDNGPKATDVVEELCDCDCDCDVYSKAEIDKRLEMIARIMRKMHISKESNALTDEFRSRFLTKKHV